MNGRVNFLRFLFVAYGLATFILALVFSGFVNPAFWQGFLLVVGLVLYIVAGVTLRVAHKTEKRPVAELIPALLYPVLAYYLMFFSFDLGTKRFWMFIGYFQFLVLTGGFMLGIFLAPVIARRSYSKEQVAGVVKFGLRYIKSIRREAFALVLFTGIWISLAYFAARLMSRLGRPMPRQWVVFCAFFVSALVILTRFTYRHTVFNLMKDEKLKDAYAKDPPLRPADAVKSEIRNSNFEANPKPE